MSSYLVINIPLKFWDVFLFKCLSNLNIYDKSYLLFSFHTSDSNSAYSVSYGSLT